MSSPESTDVGPRTPLCTRAETTPDISEWEQITKLFMLQNREGSKLSAWFNVHIGVGEIFLGHKIVSLWFISFVKVLWYSNKKWPPNLDTIRPNGFNGWFWMLVTSQGSTHATRRMNFIKDSKPVWLFLFHPQSKVFQARAWCHFCPDSVLTQTSPDTDDYPRALKTGREGGAWQSGRQVYLAVMWKIPAI